MVRLAGGRVAERFVCADAYRDFLMVLPDVKLYLLLTEFSAGVICTGITNVLACVWVLEEG